MVETKVIERTVTERDAQGRIQKVVGRELTPEPKATPEPPPRREPPTLDDVVDVTVLRILESLARPEVLAHAGPLPVTVVPPDESRSVEFGQEVGKRLQASPLYVSLCAKAKWTKVHIVMGSSAPADAVAQPARQSHITATRPVGFRGGEVRAR